jgi:hypothetical protein
MWEKTASGEFVPKASKSRPQTWGEPSRFEVAVKGGSLVARDEGEFEESGLYWLGQGSTTLQRVTVEFETPIRRVYQTPSGIVGVAGLCHGSGPFTTAVVSLLPTTDPTKWHVRPIGHIRGCPAAVQLTPQDGSLVVATADGEGLVAISTSNTASKTTVLGTWPAQYHPFELEFTTRDDSSTTFYVGFGRTVATFRDDTRQWYTLRGCIEDSSK